MVQYVKAFDRFKFVLKEIFHKFYLFHSCIAHFASCKDNLFQSKK